MFSDEELYRQYLDGNEESLRTLLERHAKGLTLFINGYMNNIDDAKELMLDSFVVVASRKNSFEGKSSFKTWLFSVGRNLALSRIRKEKFHLIPIDEAIDIAASSKEPEDRILDDENKRILYRALQNINENYRNALYLIYIEDMSYEEAGRVLKKSRKQIDNLVSRGKTALRAALEKEGYRHTI